MKRGEVQPQFAWNLVDGVFFGSGFVSFPFIGGYLSRFANMPVKYLAKRFGSP